MRNLFGTHAGLVALGLVQFAAGEPLIRSEWSHFSPILKSDVRTLRQEEADKMLARFCKTQVHAVQGIDLTCTTRRLGPGFSDIVDSTFHPRGLIFGHFLGPESDEVAVSGSSAEGHPERLGGTLLLSRRGGAWIPIWYRSGLIIDSCEKIAMPTRREILLCEDEDGGMGHALHYLYGVDFEHPSDLEHSLLAKAESFKDDCVSQKQVMKGFHWRSERMGFSVEVDTIEWHRLSTEPYCGKYTKERPSSLRLTFAVTSDGLPKIEGQQQPKQ